MDTKFTFFCELDSMALLALFDESHVSDDLAALDASLSLAILDFSPERVEIVRRLNQAGIPVIAWLLLPREQGYWFNLGNANQAVDRYNSFKAWTAENGLDWQGIGIDIEPDYGEMEALMQGRKQVFLPILRRVLNVSAMRNSTAAYWKLVSQMQADGYRVDSYHFPFIVDERKAGSTWLQRLAGLVDVPTDREVFMLYTSLLRPHGPGILWSYASEPDCVGVGSTGGGVQMEGMGDIPPLDWVELTRDLRLARSWTEHIHIFSLEGCVRQGFMEGLKCFDWSGPVTIPLESAKRVNLLRKGVRGFLWASAHPILVLFVILASRRLLSRLFSRKS